jgi:hypothetical protein
VAERVVDDLEVVEVEEEQGDARPAAPPAGQRALDVIAEQDPVGETGERIVERVVEGWASRRLRSVVSTIRPCDTIDR